MREGSSSGKAARREKRRAAAQEEKRETARTARANEICIGLTTQNVSKMSTMETIDKLMMAEALQECLSRFPKTLTL